MEKQIRTCVVCGTPLRNWQKATCSLSCHSIRQQQKKEVRYQEHKKPRLDKPKERVKVKQIMTDEEQFKINQQIDASLKSPCEYKRYRPGDAEFEAMAAKIMPLDKIHNIAHKVAFACMGEEIC